MKALKSARTLAASLGVLAFGALAATPAMAFDNVHWSWNKHVNEWVNINACIHLNVDISGMVEVEKLQIFLGDATADSTVHNIYNTPFYLGSGGGKDGGGHEGGGYGGKDDLVKGPPGGPGGSSYYVADGYRHKVEFDKVPVKPLDATTQLPIVLSSATAVGNNQSITSDVPVFLHDGQFVADVKDHQRKAIWDNPDAMLGALGNTSSPTIGPNGYSRGPGLNTNTVFAVLFGLGAVSGELHKSDIKATSTVYDIKNASVDSSASAVANNISVDLQSDKLSDHVLIADITQFALANVTATSNVYDVSATGYDNMRQLTTATLQSSGNTTDIKVDVPTPWISSTATAVGNNTTINVSGVKRIVGH
jgi:hypothetical protein